MTSIISAVKSKFLEALRSVNPPGRWKVLVVDEHSKQLLGSVLKQFDILEENVTVVEAITNYREPQPGMEAMYLLMSTSQNVDRIIRDFSGGQPLYAAAHLFFIDALPEPLLQKLASSPADPYLKTLQELYVNFWAIESQAFSLQRPALFFNMYSPPRGDATFKAAREQLEEEMRLAARMIVNLCVTTNELPYIRYYVPPHHPPLGPLKPHASTRPPPPSEGSSRWRTNLARGNEARAFESVEGDHLSKLLAFMVQQGLDEYKRSNPDFPKTERPRSTLIITDRSMDMMAPFVHEFTYQAMANDLLPIEGGTKYMYKFQTAAGVYEDKVAVLSDSDNVWTELRHKHMREAIDKLMTDFNQFMQENAGFKGEGAVNLDAMKDLLANLPQYQEQREKFSLHLNMAEGCMNIFDAKKLANVAMVEQNCATGLTASGSTPKTLVEEMVPLLDSRDLHNYNKVRIIALYIQFRGGVPDEDRRRLYQHARLTLPEQDAVNALVHLGIRISRGPADKDIKPRIKQKPSKEEEYELSRYKPLLSTVLEEHVNNRLDPTLFPYVKDAPTLTPAPSLKATHSTGSQSLRSQKPVWHRAARPGAQDNRQRLMIFVAGGMTYSEMRETYLLSNSLNKDIIIGSTHTVTPREFIEDLKVVEIGGVGSRVLPNGLREGHSQRPFQEFYDEIYYTRDAPPPQRQPAQPASQLRAQPGRSAQPSPIPSYASGNSASVGAGGAAEKEKKKKKGFLRF
ncbi:Sec1-like protein [Trametopsis cervina]|nr:Sec1-like protein [Trametopsis cervina]